MNETIVLAFLIALPPTLAAVASIILAIKSNRKIEALHVAVNSRLTELLVQTAKASRAEGVASETNKK